LTTARDSRICPDCGAEIKPYYLELYKKTFWPMCKCEGDKDRAIEARLQQEERQRKLDTLFQQSRLGEKFKNATFENYKRREDTEKVYQFLKKYAENFRDYGSKSVLLLSHPGTGKTLLASCVVNHLLSKNITAVFVDVPDLLGKITATYNSDSKETEERILWGLCECDLLVLDDIGAERHKVAGADAADDWANEKLYRIINGRYKDSKPILYTTNNSLKMLNTRLGDRTFSRIAEMTEELSFSMEHVPDFRMKRFYKG
jgi:DNA replication protein DnaC